MKIENLYCACIFCVMLSCVTLRNGFQWLHHHSYKSPGRKITKMAVEIIRITDSLAVNIRDFDKYFDFDRIDGLQYRLDYS